VIVRVAVVGHIDHGKSTLIAHLLHETGNLPEDALPRLREAAAERGRSFEWAFALDALQSERDQSVTVDATQVWLRLGERRLVLVDVPGHREFLRNMVSGASDADAALLVVAADEGVSSETRRHACVLNLLGIRDVAVVITKMDRRDWSQAAFEDLAASVRRLCAALQLETTACIPIAADTGEGLVEPSKRAPWYAGPTVQAALLAFTPREDGVDQPLRMAVQGVWSRNGRSFALGKIGSGTLRSGAEVALLPGGQKARVGSLEIWPNGEVGSAATGESVAVAFDPPHFVDRGVVVVAPPPPLAVDRFRARVLRLGDAPLRAGDDVILRMGTSRIGATLDSVQGVFDQTALSFHGADAVQPEEIADVVIRPNRSVEVQSVANDRKAARFAISDGLKLIGCGVVLEPLPRSSVRHVARAEHLIDAVARAKRTGHQAATVWLTGIPAAGKSTIAMHLEQRLFRDGYQTYVLDGDNIRAGLSDDLGFGARERQENARRIGEVAALFADAGLVVIVAAISPYRADRELARRTAPGIFVEVHVKAELATCERRDPKGLFKKARAGQVRSLSGIDDVYEIPLNPEVELDTDRLTVSEAVEVLYAYLRERIGLIEPPATASEAW